MQNYLVLIGIVIIVVGFVLKLDVISVVLIAGFATGLAGGKGVVEILDIIGKGFVDNRYMSLFFTTLIVIGMMERYGLKEKAADGIKKIRGVTISGGTVEVKGKTGISGFDGIRGEKLVVTDATLKATGSPYGSLCNLTSLTLGGGCQIISPEGASFSSELHFVNQNGTRIITQVLITKPKEHTPPESKLVDTDKLQISVDKEEPAPVVTEPVATDEKQAVTE